MDKQTILKKSRYIMKAFVPSKVLQSRLHMRVFMQFAEKIGLVYFGYVDQRNDEHRLIRGLTVSSSHRDNHYCIGDFDGYDIMLVERTDTMRFPGKSTKAHDWIIMTFDLHTKQDLPHIFLGLHTHDEVFYAHLFAKFSHLSKASLGTFGNYDANFMNHYAIYVEPAQAITAERLLDAQITKAIGDNFNGLTVEITDGSLYLYAEHRRPTVAFLEKMLKHGVWLAKELDERASQI